jgi:DNA (cytosine-5)-methyltransferase 1
LAKGAHAPAIAFQPRFARNDRGAPIEEVAYPITAESDGDSAKVVAFQDRFRGDDGRGYDRPPAVAEDVCGTLETVKPWNVARKWSVRRLMPVECERLQGFKDGYTAIQYRGKPAADGPRYKVLGNSMSTNSMRWIGRRIQMVEEVIRNG